MDHWPGRNIPKLTQEEIHNSNLPTSVKEIESRKHNLLNKEKGRKFSEREPAERS